MGTENRTTKVCPKCGRELPLSEFHKKTASKDGIQVWCKHCSNAARSKKKIDYSPKLNPVLADMKPRELQDQMRVLASELRARGFNCEIKISFLQEISI